MSACAGNGSSSPTSIVSAATSRPRSRCASTLAFPPSPYVPSSDGKTRAIRTASPRGRSGIAENFAIALERAVVGQHLDRTAAVYGAQRVIGIVDAVMVDAGVAQPHRDVAGTVTGRHRVPAAQSLERHVPQPRRVAAV